MVKPYKTIKEQITLLKNRGLEVNNDEFANYLLNIISYYRLSSYRFPIFNKSTDSYLEGYSIKDLKRLHDIDSQYRTYLYYVIQIIEVTFRSLLVNNLSVSDPYFYSKEINFNFKETIGSDEKKKNALERKDKFFKKLRKTINNTNNIHISFYQEKHNEEINKKVSTNKCNYRKNNCKVSYAECNCIPEAWVAFESFDFGQLIEIYSKLREDLFQDKKDDIARFFSVSYNDLLNMLEDIRRIRNILAHHDQIINRYSYKKSKSMKFLKRYYIGIGNQFIYDDLLTKKKGYYQSTFLPYFLVIKYFLDILFDNKFSSELPELSIINDCLKISENPFYKASLSLQELPIEIFKRY